MHEQAFTPEALVLDPEKAARIAGHFAIEIYGVEHGHTAEQLAELMPGVHPDSIQPTVTDEKRAVAQTLADSLRPGHDVLFREGYGYSTQARTSQPDKTPTPEQRLAAKQMLTAGQGEYDAISYAGVHAYINGTQVFNADSTAEQSAAHKAAGMDLAHVETARNIDAIATVINYAADNLPEEGTPLPTPEERRRLMVLFGGSHTAEMKQLADAAGLPITVYTTQETKKIAGAQLAAKYFLAAIQGGIDSFINSKA